MNSANTSLHDGLHCPVLAYHELGWDNSRDVYALHPAVFRQHIRAAEHAAAKRNITFELTFDDAHRSQVEFAAPILEEEGLRGIFFVPGAWIEYRRSAANWRELRGLVASGHRIGAHGLTHALLTQCSPTKLVRELKLSKELLEQQLGCSIDWISAPGGRWNLLVARASADVGYQRLYTSDPRTANGYICESAGLTICGRLAVRRTMPPALIAGYISQTPLLCARLSAEYRIKSGLKRIFGDDGYQALWSRLVRSPGASSNQ